MFSNRTCGFLDLGITEVHIHFLYNVEKLSRKDFLFLIKCPVLTNSTLTMLPFRSMFLSIWQELLQDTLHCIKNHNFTWFLLRNLPVFVKFPHQENGWNFDVLRSPGKYQKNGNHNYFFKDQAKQNKKAATVKQTKKRKLLTTVLPALILLVLEFSKESWYRRTKSRTSL